MNDDARTQLQYIIGRYGISICEDARRCEAMLRDLCPGCKREIFALVNAIKEDIPQELIRASEAIPRELFLAELSKRLCDNLGIKDDLARWAVESWGIVLQVLIQENFERNKTGTDFSCQHVSINQIIMNEKDGTQMVLIPEGDFLAGEPGQFEGDSEMFPVWLPAYYLSLYPITNIQYAHFLNQEQPSGRMLKKWIWLYNSCFVGMVGDRYEAYGNKNDHPVVSVSWYGAKAYAEWAGLRLPSELEWEKGARGVDGRIFPWGNAWDKSKCCCAMNAGTESTCSAHSYPGGRSPWGIYHMSGNTVDWCEDWYDSNAYDLYRQGKLSPQSDSYKRLLRGSSWDCDDPECFCVTVRGGLDPEGAPGNVGFRLAKTAALCNQINIPLKHRQTVIPPLAVTTDIPPQKTAEIVAIVGPKTQEKTGGQDVFAEGKVSNSNPYEGKPIVYTYTLFNAVQIANARLQKPEFSGFTAKEVENSRKTYRTVMNGREYNVTVLTIVLVPIGAGLKTIDPAILECDLVFRQGKLERRVIRTEPLRVTVKAPPPYWGR